MNLLNMPGSSCSSTRTTLIRFSALPAWLILPFSLCFCAVDSQPPTPGPAGAGGVGGGSGGFGAGGAGGTTAIGAECAAPDAALSTSPSAELFGVDHVPAFDFYMPPQVWSDLKRNARDEQYVEALACFEGRAVGKVGLRFKGSYGTLFNCFDANGNQTCPKLSMKVKFDKFEQDLRFFGMKLLNFNSMLHDASRLHDRLGYDLYREMGVIAPRASFATLRVNGETQGLFGMVEQIDGRFTDDRFPKNGDGDLYKEAWPTSVDPAYYAQHLETNSDTANHEVPIQLANALSAAGSARAARAELGRFMDLSYLYRYMAVDDAILNVDGVTAVYTDETSSWSNNHNFYLYGEEERPFMWLLPWDLDATFEFGTFGNVPHWTQRPEDCSQKYPVWSGGARVTAPGCDPVFAALASDLTEYQSVVAELLDGPMSERTMLERIDQHASFIRAAVAADPTGPSPEAFEAALTHLKGRIPLLRARMQSVAQGKQPVPFAFEPQALNDFEQVETFEMLLGATLMSNQNSHVSFSINQESALGGSRDLAIEFTYGNDPEPWNQWLYFSVPFRGNRVDGTALTGIRMKVKADKSRTLRLDLESPKQTAVSAGVRFGWDVPIGAETQEIEVRFADAKVQSWAVTQGLDPKDDLSEVLSTLSGLAFNPSCEGRDAAGFLPTGTSDEGRLEVDDIELF